MKYLNVLVADDQPIFVEGLRAVLSEPAHPIRCRVSGVANNFGEVRELLDRQDTDLLLLDLQLPESEGFRILPVVKNGQHNMRVLIMALHNDPHLVRAALKAGADGYMLKSGTKDELFKAIETVTAGNTFIGSGLSLQETHAAAKNKEYATAQRFAQQHGLTRRELEIMHFIGQAMNNKDIAKKLYISDQTVSVHRKNIMRKLGVNSTASLIKIAFENHLV